MAECGQDDRGRSVCRSSGLSGGVFKMATTRARMIAAS